MEMCVGAPGYILLWREIVGLNFWGLWVGGLVSKVCSPCGVECLVITIVREGIGVRSAGCDSGGGGECAVELVGRGDHYDVVPVAVGQAPS